MYSATTISEYLALLDEAIFELEEMAYCVGEEPDDELVDLAPHCQQIADYIKSLKQDVSQGNHKFDDKELEYVPLVRRLKNVLPFYGLLNDINRIHLCSDLCNSD